MKKIIILTLVFAVFAMLVGFGVTNATADEDNDVEWELVETAFQAEVEAHGTAVGPIDLEFNIIHPEGGGDIEIEVEVRTTFGIFFGGGLTEEDIKVEIEFDNGVPIEGEAELNTFIEGCGEVAIETEFDIEEVGEYVIDDSVIFDDEGTPFEREIALEVNDVEIREAVICGIDLLGEILGDGEVEGQIKVAELFEPQFEDEGDEDDEDD